MANTFVNAGDVNISTSGDIVYTCDASTQCLIHALYLSNIDGTNSVDATVEVTFDGGTTYVPIAKTVPVPADSTLILDKPLNLEAGDKLKVTASVAGDLSVFASIRKLQHRRIEMAFIGSANISPSKNLVEDITPQLGGNLDFNSNTVHGVDATEMAILDGATVTTAELNILDGVTSTAAELNILDGVTSTAAELNILDGVTSTTAELNVVDMSASSSTSGQLLTSNGTGSVSTWQDAPQGVSNSKLFYFGSFT